MQSLIVWEGASRLNGAPIVAILTGASKNAKTGDMRQLWILHAEVEPHVAIKTGDDEAVCGGCTHRGENGTGRTCYVLVHNAPLAIFRAYKRGSYEHATPAALSEALSGAMLRLGAYGDPLALPLSVLEGLTALASGYTGYSHQWEATLGWEDAERARAAALVMASVETREQALSATLAGYRYFRTRSAGDALPADEIDCPSERGVQCAECGLCSGTQRAKARSVSIPLHGGTAVMANAAKRGLINVTNV